MQGHIDEKLSAVLKLRIEPELKDRVTALAKRRRKTAAQLLREKLWQIVEEDERAAQTELPLTGTHGGGR